MDEERHVVLEPPIVTSSHPVLHLAEFTLRHLLGLQLRQFLIPGLLELFGRRIAAGLGLEREESGEFAGVGGGPRRPSDGPALHHPGVEPAGPLVEQFGEHVERVAVDMAGGHRVVADLDGRRHVPLGVHPLLGDLVDLQCHDRRRRLRARIEPREIPGDERLRRHGIEVAHHDAKQVAGTVVDVPVIHRLVEGVAVQVARPADDRPRIAARLPKHGVELFLEAARGCAVGAEPPLFVHHIPLGVKLAKHAVVEPVALHPGPELQLVGRHGDEVAGEVVAGEGVHAAAAGLGVDLIELVLDDRGRLGPSLAAALLGTDQRVEPTTEHPQFLRVVGGIPGIGDLAPLETFVLLRPDDAVDLVADGLLFGAILRVAIGVTGADRVGPLEHHVFEEVADAGDAGPLIDAPHPRHPARTDDVGLITPRHEQKPHTVVELELLDRDLLRQCRRRQQKTAWQQPQDQQQRAKCVLEHDGGSEESR